MPEAHESERDKEKTDPFMAAREEYNRVLELVENKEITGDRAIEMLGLNFLKVQTAGRLNRIPNLDSTLSILASATSTYAKIARDRQVADLFQQVAESFGADKTKPPIRVRASGGRIRIEK